MGAPAVVMATHLLLGGDPGILHHGGVDPRYFLKVGGDHLLFRSQFLDFTSRGRHPLDYPTVRIRPVQVSGQVAVEKKILKCTL